MISLRRQSGHSRYKARLTTCAVCAVMLWAYALRAAETVSHPFAGLTHIVREDRAPRPVRMHLILVELGTPGIRFLLTPPHDAGETVKQTTLQFLTEQQAQVAINVHYFEPWPPPNPDPGTAHLIGLAASAGRIYSPFAANPPKPYAIRPNAPGLNIDAGNHARIVHRGAADSTGRATAEGVPLYNALSGNEQILTGGEITAGTGKWDNTPNPLTVIGLTAGGRLVMLIVDGRQPGISEGLSTREAAELLGRDYAVSDALNLDGGGSATLCLADPEPRVANIPVGKDNVPGTLRAVGSNLAIFALPLALTGAEVPGPAPAIERASYVRPLIFIGSALVILLLLTVILRRKKR